MKSFKNILFLPVLLLMACSDSATPSGNNGNNTETPHVNYDNEVVVPAIQAVDENDYTVYYVNPATGNDNNDGLSERTPFKTLEKIVTFSRDALFRPKTKVLLKSGAAFEENIVLKNLAGTPEKPFIFDIYGGTERATINGTSDQAVLIQDDNIRFCNIRVTNPTGARGIRVQTGLKGTGAFRNMVITGCRIEAVNWTGHAAFEGVDPETINVELIAPGDRFSNKEYGGIILETNTTVGQGPSWYENLFITNNEIKQVCRSAILITAKWGQRDKPGNGLNGYISDEQNWYPNRTVVVQGNDISYAGGDGLIMMGCTDSYIDHNRCYHANFLGRSGQASAGLWPYCCTNITMQFNEAAYTWLAHGSADGQGLDVDIACKNTLVQYNYVHHNKGGGILLCNIKEGDHSGTIIRNNIFYKNEGAYRGSLMTVSSSVGKTEVYNNLVIINAATPKILFTDDWANAGKSHDFHYYNNIFTADVPCTGAFDKHNMEPVLFENNLFFQVGSAYTIDSKALRYDPKIAFPNSPDGFGKTTSFRPAESKVFQDGFLFDRAAAKDILGNDVMHIKYVGAIGK
ncbi:MAG: right-handed parallel beta-helix repeat-containing protein [Dysgonamonadaceae bacterium]|jgi:hypothetical protein|nr:right-handed parallel beta-helix repeat-containing protein [Dysgonamonadaceae bacterium]